MDSDFDRSWIILEEEQAHMADTLSRMGITPLVLVSEERPGNIRDFSARWTTAGVMEGDFPTCEPYGDVPFAQLVADCRRRGEALKEAGAGCIFIRGVRTLLQARGAVLGAREAGLPLLVAMELDGEGRTLPDGGDILSAFVVLQELGVAAFGFSSGAAGVMLPALDIIRPYSRIPVISITLDMAAGLGDEELGDLFTKRTSALLDLGATMIGVRGAAEAHLAETARTMAGAAPGGEREKVNYLDADEVWAAGETQVYFLDSALEYSPPLVCQRDMADAVIEAEHEGWPALCVEVASPDEGEYVSLNNANLSRSPVVFLSHDAGALAAALFFYNGRAIVDSRSQLSEEELEAVAAKYGAVVL